MFIEPYNLDECSLIGMALGAPSTIKSLREWRHQEIRRVMKEDTMEEISRVYLNREIEKEQLTKSAY